MSLRAVACRVVVLTCWIACFTPVLHAAEPRPAVPPEEPKPLTVDDVIGMESAREFDISPDGKWVVWIKVSPDKEKSDLKQNVFLSSTRDTVTLQLTRTTRKDRTPKFSPDGSKIAFVATPEKASAQIYIYDVRGGEAEKLTDVATGVEDFEWRDAKTIFFSAREDSTFRERSLAKTKDTTIIVADSEHYPPVRLFEITLEKKEVRRVTTNAGAVTEFAVSPDGRWAVTNENIDVNYTYDHRNPPLQFLIDLERNERREIMTAPHVAPYDFRWDSGGDGFFCRRPVASDSTDTYVNIDELYYFDLKSESLRRVETGWANGLGHAYVVVRGGIVAAMAGGTRDPVVYFETSGHRVTDKRTLSLTSGKPFRLLAGQHGGDRIVYLESDASTAPRIMTAVVNKRGLTGEKKLAPFNEALANKRLAQGEVVRWKGALDDEVEGVLYYPIGYEPGKKYPLVAAIHGGPSGVDTDFFTANWADYPHILAAKGAFVLNVNYHGSGDYGLRWVESIKGHYYEYEIPDIMSGIDALVERGLADPDKLGIMGWSNGAILAIEACLRSDRFKALSAGAGDVNWTSDYGNCAFGAAFDNAYFGGAPWDMPDTYIEKSPFFRLRGMKTPTLVMFGTRDTSVPTEQGWQLFRAMQQIGNAPVRFLLFPDEPHGLGKIAHRKRKMEEEIAWFDQHLFGTYLPPEEAFDTSSPLAMAIEKAKVARDGLRYGEIVDGVLIPEVVEFEGMKVGRFEVTQSQFKAFRPSYEIAPGKENYPVSDVTYEDARAYCEWLGGKTGRRFRLPTTEEMARITERAKSNLAQENNLDHWIGYAPTPDEREALAAKIQELEKSRSLVEEVGSFRPAIVRATAYEEAGGDTASPKATVYDLGGNVAEWVTDKDGGKVMGLSAVSPRDKALPYAPPPSTYVGFRVVEE